jgi:hypothetical protein
MKWLRCCSHFSSLHVSPVGIVGDVKGISGLRPFWGSAQFAAHFAFLQHEYRCPKNGIVAARHVERGRLKSSLT